VGDHLLVMHSAVRACPGYDRHEAPSMLMDGASVARDTEHGRAVTAQLTRRHGTLEEAIDAANFALSAADVPRGIRRQARAACEDYFYERLGLTPAHQLRTMAPIDSAFEPLAEPMQKALEDVVELVVDGEYEDLRELSQNRLDVEDMRRRVEDDCPQALVLPPREIYRVEAVTVLDDDPEHGEGWAFFLELWTEDGPAILHLEGLLHTSGPGFEVTLKDILP
jgi:hypothetical protein